MDILNEWFAPDWELVLRTAVVGTATYVSIILLLRISGKRTLSKMNMFDWVVTVAMGSMFASMLLNPEISFTRGISAFILLAVLQFIVTSLSVRSDKFANLVKADPTILFYQGRFMEGAMRKERVPKEEILSAIRQSGQGAPALIAAVILESSGELIVMNKVEEDQGETLSKAGNWNAASRNDHE